MTDRCYSWHYKGMRNIAYCSLLNNHKGKHKDGYGNEFGEERVDGQMTNNYHVWYIDTDNGSVEYTTIAFDIWDQMHLFAAQDYLSANQFCIDVVLASEDVYMTVDGPKVWE